MGTVNIIKNIKQIHQDDVVIVKVGNFYNTYGRDAYIISYLFGYKIRKAEDNISVCGFPINSFNRILAKLEERKINYLIVDRKNEYEINEKLDNKNLNTYKRYFEKAKEYVNFRLRIDKINEFMLQNIEKKDFKNIIIKMEEIVNEGRKISSS